MILGPARAAAVAAFARASTIALAHGFALVLALVLAWQPAPAAATPGWAPAALTAPRSIDDAARIVLATGGGAFAGAAEQGGGDTRAASDARALREPREPGKAFLLSMLLPGLGHRYAGHDSRALALFLGEAGLWTTFAVYKIQGNAREEDFEEWAKLFSGGTIEGRDRGEEYYQRISRYLSSDDYNFEVKAIARLIYPGDTPDVRAQQLAYIEENAFRGDESWEWTSQERRNDFRVIRHRALDADRHANWTLGGLVLLRALAAIDAVLVAKHDNRARGDVGFSASPVLPSGDTGFSLVYSRPF